MKEERPGWRESNKAVSMWQRETWESGGPKCLNKRKNNGDGNKRRKKEDIKDIESSGLRHF